MSLFPSCSLHLLLSSSSYSFTSSYRSESRDSKRLKTLKISKEIVCGIVHGSALLFTSAIHVDCLKVTHVPKLNALIMRTTRQDVSIT